MDGNLGGGFHLVHGPALAAELRLGQEALAPARAVFPDLPARIAARRHRAPILGRPVDARQQDSHDRLPAEDRQGPAARVQVRGVVEARAARYSKVPVNTGCTLPPTRIGSAMSR